ncbi:MAG TPA: hypothetical protein VMT42_04730 [candidate division Zixibacteria bacterium]|nr:hypothetical protein [candidate division Zixibacteria bacterium]
MVNVAEISAAVAVAGVLVAVSYYILDVSNQASVTEISAVVAVAGVLVAVSYYLLDVRNQAIARKTDLVIRLYSIISSKDFLEAWEKFRDREFKSLSDYKEEYGLVEYNQVMALFEEVGVLLQRKLIDAGIVFDLFGDEIKNVKEKLGQTGLKDRRAFEYLYNEMKKREQRMKKTLLSSVSR